MDNDSAAEALRDLRTHATTIMGHVTDFHTKFQELEHEAEARFTAIQHAQEALLQHLQQERDRARAENAQLTAYLRESTDWLHQAGTTIQNESKALGDDLTAATEACGHDTTTLDQATSQLQQLAQKNQQDYATTSHDLQEHVETTHEHAHEQFLAGFTQMQQSVTQTATQHEQTMEAGFHTDFTHEQTTVHAHIEQIATAASQTIEARGTTLHADVSHDVDTLHQTQEQHHQDLQHHLSSTKETMSHMGSVVTDTAHGLGDGVDGATTMVQVTNVGVEEVLKIIQNIESVFQEIIGSYHS